MGSPIKKSILKDSSKDITHKAFFDVQSICFLTDNTQQIAFKIVSTAYKMTHIALKNTEDGEENRDNVSSVLSRLFK